MHTSLWFAAALATIAAATPAFAFDDDTPLRSFVAECDSNHASCIDDLIIGIESADGLVDACVPQGLSENDAAEQELRWMRNAAASNAGLASGKKIDAEWTALNTMWPCN